MQEINYARQERSARNSPIASSEEVAKVIFGRATSASKDREDVSSQKEYRCRVCDGPVEWPDLVCQKCWRRDREEQEWESYLEFMSSDDPAPEKPGPPAKNCCGTCIFFERLMGDKQINLFMKKADQEPKIKVPASIEKEGRAMLEPEEQKNVVIIDRRIEDKYPKSDTANNLHNPTVCPMCKQDKKLQWVNPGGLGANIEICRDCVPKLFEGYGYKEPGYRIIDENTVEIFSETTGWERIKTYWVRKFLQNIFANKLFPLCVYLEHAEIRKRNKHGESFNLDHNTYGITWACARVLSIKANVPIPEALVRRVLQGNKR